MLEALKLARKGLGSVEPNPAVGCVIVKNGKIIGKGYHKKFGNPHAEIEALKDCVKKGNNPAGSTVYVTLEPCCHFGKTGPCTDALIAAKVKKVIAATSDPSPHAAGKGFKLLKKSGIEVAHGLLAKEAKEINLPFFKYASTGRPWIILKWAQSIDAKLACSNNRWITSEQSRADVHALRRRTQAILVGINTVLADDPLLTPRPPANDRRPLRIILDPHLQTPLTSNIVKTASSCPVLIFTSAKALKTPKAVKIQKMNVICSPLPLNNSKFDLAALLNDLSKRNGISQLLVEGGPTVLASFLAAGLVDEFRIYIAPKILARSGSADISAIFSTIASNITMSNIQYLHIGPDICISALAGPAAR